MYYILRNNQRYGPYDIKTLLQYVEAGKILLRDQCASENTPSEINTVNYYLKQAGLKPKIQNSGSIISQIKVIGRELILPKSILSAKEWKKDKRLLILSFAGLAPAFLIKFTFTNIATFYAIALYFSVIWALFFYYLFQTPQVKVKTTILVFFLSQLFVLLFINLQNFPGFSFLYSLTNSSFFLFRMIGYIFGVGLLEECIKALPLFVILRRAKEPLIPQTLVYYGLISGISFGVLEGVQYQTTVNAKLSYSESFFMNVARLTSLPFLHAVWCGIAGYFISFSDLYPRYRKSLILLAIAIPAILHGLYNTFGWSILGLIITLAGVVLLMCYLNKSVDYQSKLNN